MKIILVDPHVCTRWQYADRSPFEFGNIPILAEDLQRNGQIEPAIIRLSKNPKAKYEIIAGSRRWKACLEAGIELKATLLDIDDEEASIIQIKENQGLDICDYSKGIYYDKLLADNKITQDKLAQNINISRQKLQHFLSFSKVPQVIWDTVGNMSKVSYRTASTIYTLSQKGEHVIHILINLAEEIRKGIGCTKLENLVNQILLGDEPEQIQEIALPSGATIGTWKNNTLKLVKNIHIKKDDFLQHIISFFESPTN